MLTHSQQTPRRIHFGKRSSSAASREQTATHPLTEPYVGASLNCTSCHLDNGTHPTAATFLEVATAYPAWAAREETVVTLEDRVLNCFMRSCNGTRPPQGSLPAVAITTYITSLSEGLPMQMNGESPHGPRRVKALAIRSGRGGRGQRQDALHRPLRQLPRRGWRRHRRRTACLGAAVVQHGRRPFHVEHLAAWLKVAMPLHEADLTDAESLDIAAYVNSHDRPALDIEEHLPAAEGLGVYNGKRGNEKAAVQDNHTRAGVTPSSKTISLKTTATAAAHPPKSRSSAKKPAHAAEDLRAFEVRRVHH